MQTLTTAHVDWLQITVDYNPTPPEILGVVWGSARSCRGNYKFEYPSNIKGLTFRFNPEDERLGSMVSMDGGAIGRLKGKGIESLTLVSMVSMWEVKNIPRMDVCINAFGYGSVPHFIQAVNRGEYISLATPSKIVREWLTDQKNRGWSAYIGAPTSHKRIRIYDKAAEQKVLPFPWMRAEYQARDDAGKQALETLLSSGVAMGIRALIKKFIDFPKSRAWGRMMDEVQEEVQPIGRKTPDWEKWLLEQVLPSINNKIEEGEHLDAIQDFINKIKL